MRLYFKKKIKTKECECMFCNNKLSKKSHSKAYCSNCDITFLNYKTYLSSDKYKQLEIINKEQFEKYKKEYEQDQQEREQIRTLLNSNISNAEVSNNRREALNRAGISTSVYNTDNLKIVTVNKDEVINLAIQNEYIGDKELEKIKDNKIDYHNTASSTLTHKKKRSFFS